ncbi:SprT-like domain-containing protein, partial [Haladaptatus sp. DYF46]
MSRQTTLSDGAQRTLTECANAAERADTLTTERGLLDRAQQHAADVAAAHFPNLPIEAVAWEISTQRQRSAGATKYDPANGEITITLSWDAFEQHGWEQFSSTVRHELIHAWQYHEFGKADHGRTFARWT